MFTNNMQIIKQNSKHVQIVKNIFVRFDNKIIHCT